LTPIARSATPTRITFYVRIDRSIVLGEVGALAHVLSDDVRRACSSPPVRVFAYGLCNGSFGAVVELALARFLGASATTSHVRPVGKGLVRMLWDGRVGARDPWLRHVSILA